MKTCNECKAKHRYYRNPCLKCLPKQKPGPKYKGDRERYIARLNENQIQLLSDRYGGSFQRMIDEVLKK